MHDSIDCSFDISKHFNLSNERILKTEARNNYNGIRTFRVNCDRS